MAATIRDPRVKIAPDYVAKGRRARHPQHKFNLKTLPYQIQPFMVAPVLPGETVQNILLQTRVVSDPLSPKMKLIGWWAEYYFFYFKHRDIDAAYRTTIENLLLVPGTSLAALATAADPLYFHNGNGVNWVKWAMIAIIKEYFRDEGEDWFTPYLVPAVGGLPIARIYGKGQNDAIDKLTMNDEYVSRGVSVDPGGTGAATVEDLNYAYQQWAALKDAGLMAMDYQDFMATYGSQVREAEVSVNLHRPELIRHIREWSYPTNTVEATTGVPSTAVTWSIADRSDKKVFCSEPGFIVGLTVKRPKIYMSGQGGAIANGMTNVRNWIPAILQGQSDISHINFGVSDGPFDDRFPAESGYWLDLRDLFEYGDQFFNYTPAVGEPGFLGLPSATGARRYATETEIAAMFLTLAGEGQDEKIKEDGVCSLSILSRQEAARNQLILGTGGLTV